MSDSKDRAGAIASLVVLFARLSNSEDPCVLHIATFYRSRTMSGTIPSMESSHHELGENTIIVGEFTTLPRSSVMEPIVIPMLSFWGFW